MKTAFIIHGFNGDTTYTFGPYLKVELEKRGYNVIMPNFPIRSEATYLGWSSILNNYKKLFDSDTIIVCHSIGNPFIVRYISENKLKAKLYISVAGFCKLFIVPDRDDLTNAFIDFKVSENDINYCIKNITHRYSLYSDNDHVIPFNILEDFIKELNSIPVFISGVGHMGNRISENFYPKIAKTISNISDEIV